MAERITFYSDGIELVGYLYAPEAIQGGEKRSAVVLCPGFGAHQERFLPQMASHLANNGFVALTFDYRGFGESEGHRWRMIPQEQVKDISSAITFLQLQDAVDSDQIGLHGISFGGANVCYVASVDPRVKCLVSIVGVGCGEKWLRGLRRTWEWKAFLKELEGDRRHRAANGASRIVDRLHIMLPDPKSAEMIRLTQKRYPDTCTDMPLETAEAVINFHPEEVMKRAPPECALFIVAEEDDLVPDDNTRELYRAASEPKKWVVLEGCGHYQAYGSPYFERVMAESTAWFTRFISPETG